MKVVIKEVPAGSKFKPGERLDLGGQELDTLTEGGVNWITASEQDALDREASVKTANRNAIKGLVIQAVNKAVEREALVPKGEGQNSAETVTATAVKQIEQGADPEFVIAFIDGLPGKDTVTATQRLTKFQTEQNGVPFTALQVTGIDIKDATEGYIKATQEQDSLCRSNRWEEAKACAREASVILSQNHAKKNDLLLTDAVKGATRNLDPKNIVKAATFSDPNSQVGSLAGDLILMRNLGFLRNKLNWLRYFSTDLSGEPAKFGQAVLTRYIVPPNVLTWVPGVGFTSDAGTIAAAGAGTTQSGATTQASGTVTKSVPKTVDKSVVLDMFKAVEVEFPVSLIAGTMRNLFSEQYSAQLYGLAEHINTNVLGRLFAETWGGADGVSGLTYSYVKSLNDWNLTGIIGVKNKLTIAKIPDVGRYALLHSFYHDKLLEDTNLLSAKAILALVDKDASAFNSGELPVLFGVKPLESQLASATAAGALTTWTDDTAPGTTNIVGFAGNMSAYLFVSRPPQDWTTTLTQLGIPATAAIRLVTEPDSGLTVMVFSYVDNGKMSVSQRVCLMWGSDQGDPRQGILIKNA